jgi:hypothetical protein
MRCIVPSPAPWPLGIDVISLFEIYSEITIGDYLCGIGFAEGHVEVTKNFEPSGGNET